MIEGDCEDPGQLELNWMFDHADHTADRFITHRQICRQVARELDVTVSLMPKPADDRKGNGCHHNLSLWRGEENVLVDPQVRHLADWGMDDKTCSVHPPARGRLEFKPPDALVNPCLSHAVLIAAIEDGIKNQTDPGPAQDGVGDTATGARGPCCR